MHITPELLRTAHADAWQVEGELRRPYGGDAVEFSGVRLMSSGLDHPQWNSGDVDDPALVDLEAVAAWYSARAAAWGLRLPAGASWPHGRRILTKPLMGRDLADLSAAPAAPVPSVPGLDLRPATPDDLEPVLSVDAAAFGSDPVVEGPWSAPHLSDPRVDVLLGLLDGLPVATGYGVRSDGRAGPATHVGGVCVLPAYEGRGVATALTAALLRRAAGTGVRLAHLEPETPRAAAVYRRLGFVEVQGIDIYLDNA